MSDLAWHFLRLNADGVPVLRDGKTPAPALGEWLEHDGPITICKSGLHASWRALDALQYVEWEGAVACLVEVEGVEGEQGVGSEGAKLICRRRRIVAIADADNVLRTFAREQALLVAHLWDMPPIVREFLETGDEAKRAAASAAARDAARAAASAAARAAASAAASAAARDAAWAAASAAARDAAWDAASAAASAAARDAAWDAASAAASAAAWAAAWAAASDLLESMFLSEAEWAPGEGP